MTAVWAETQEIRLLEMCTRVLGTVTVLGLAYVKQEISATLAGDCGQRNP